MDENKYIFSDDELFDLSESAPLTEGGTLDDLLAEAKEVMRAVDEAKAAKRAEAVKLVRKFLKDLRKHRIVRDQELRLYLHHRRKAWGSPFAPPSGNQRHRAGH